MDQQLLKPSAPEVKAFKNLGRTAFAWAADAPQALATCAQGLQATGLAQSTVHPTPCDDKRGRPGHGTPPDQVVYPLAGALARRIAARQALIDQHRCFILAPNALDNPRFPPHELFAGDKGQAQAERGFRCLKDPQFLASARSLKKPERIMALLMVMTVCLLVSAALEYRIRKVLTEHAATCPDQQGHRLQNPTARWVFHDFVGIHVLYLPQQWPLVLNLTEEHQHLRQPLGKRYTWFYR